MTTYADLAEDFTPRFPRALTAGEPDRVTLLLEDASFWLSVWVPGLQAAIDNDNEQVAMAAKLLVVAMVRRVLLQPQFDNGVASTTDEMGPWTQTVAFRAPDGNLYLYSRELESLRSLLRPYTGDAVSMTSPGL